jgi:hypothetical protein
MENIMSFLSSELIFIKRSFTGFNKKYDKNKERRFARRTVIIMSRSTLRHKRAKVQIVSVSNNKRQ